MAQSSAKRFSVARRMSSSADGNAGVRLHQSVEASRTRQRRWRDRNFLIGTAAVGCIVLVALLAPFFAPYGPQETDYTARLNSPGIEHPFGTDNLGRDILSRVIWGAQIDLQVGVLSILFPLVLGTILGCLTGYFGGWIDACIMRIGEVIQAFPFLILIIAIVAVLGTGLTSVYLAIALVAWVSYARLVRGEVLVTRNLEYVEAARALGASEVRTIGRHVLPNVIGPTLVYATSDVVMSIVVVTSLSYLGLAARPPSPEWGAMITDGRAFMATAWWISAFPGLAVVVTGIAFSLFGDGLADALRPGRH
jgi:peptide/nickel transport system permease protein